jgi:hypothetical protein
MGKSYVKTRWLPEVLAGPERFDIKSDAGVAIDTKAQIALNTAVSVSGTTVSVAEENNIENGIDALDTLMADNLLTEHTTTGTGSAFAFTTLAQTALTTGERWRVIFHVTATSAPTINRDGKGAKNIKFYNTSGTKAPCGSDLIVAGSHLDIEYDGTDFIVLNNIPTFAKLPCMDDGSFTSDALWWPEYSALINSHIASGKLFSNTSVSTYSLPYYTAEAFAAGVMALNGDIHFVPYYAAKGEKISIDGTVSTYALAKTGSAFYWGGVLARNGDIHFIPHSANVGQKIDVAGLVSTYSLVYSVATAYIGGVVDLNGNIHFVPYSATRGQKISPAGVVSTYSLIYTAAGAYHGGVLDRAGNIHFIPYAATVGQMVSPAGVVSTYSLAYTVASAYRGGVLDANGNIHFIPHSAVVGQKISAAGVVSTYSLAYTVASSYSGGVLTASGDIHFIPLYAAVGQKISYAGVVSTYALAKTAASAYIGGVLGADGGIHFIPNSGTVGQRINTLSGIPFSVAELCSPFWNKY